MPISSLQKDRSCISVAKLFWCWLDCTTSLCTVAFSDGLRAIKYQTFILALVIYILFMVGNGYLSGFVVILDNHNSHGTLWMHVFTAFLILNEKSHCSS